MSKIDVEKKAVEWVIKYEKLRGRNPKNVSKEKEHLGYDVLSENLKIEVKGRSKDKRPFFLLNENNIKCVEKTDDENYRLYVIMNPEENPKLIIFSRKDIMAKKKEQRQWEI